MKKETTDIGYDMSIFRSGVRIRCLDDAVIYIAKQERSVGRPMKHNDVPESFRFRYKLNCDDMFNLAKCGSFDPPIFK